VQDGDGVTVTLTSDAGTEQRRYGWIVGADGGHSTVRAAVGPRLEEVFVGEHAILADVDVDTQLPATALRMYLHPGGGGGVIPLPNGRTRFTIAVNAPPARRRPDRRRGRRTG
jgi:2-polyprenyl-6-methoxyphenol hydroxylase-like FAD-dependent oxidoreductase